MQVTFDPTNPAERNAIAALLSTFGTAAPDAPAEQPAKQQKAKAEKPAAPTPAPAPAAAAEAADRLFGQANAPAPAAETAPSPAPTPAPAPAAAPSPAPAAEGATLDDARKALIAVGEKLGAKIGPEQARAKVVSLLAEVGAQTIKGVTPENFGKVVKRAGEVLAEHGVA